MQYFLTLCSVTCLLLNLSAYASKMSDPSEHSQSAEAKEEPKDSSTTTENKSIADRRSETVYSAE